MPQVSLSSETFVITGLGEGTTYFFAIRAYDGFNWGVWPGTSTTVNSLSFKFASSSAPAAVTDLNAVTGSNTGEIDLTWTSPGDDGTTGDLKAGSKFLIKYSTVPSRDWGAMDYDWDISTGPLAPLTGSAHTVTGLSNHTTYYFYIRTSDVRQPHTRRTQLRPLRFPISRRFPRLRAWEAG